MGLPEGASVGLHYPQTGTHGETIGHGSIHVTLLASAVVRAKIDLLTPMVTIRIRTPVLPHLAFLWAHPRRIWDSGIIHRSLICRSRAQIQTLPQHLEDRENRLLLHLVIESRISGYVNNRRVKTIQPIHHQPAHLAGLILFIAQSVRSSSLAVSMVISFMAAIAPEA